MPPCSHPASSRPGPADRYAPSGLPFPPLRGGPLLVKPRTATPVHRPRTAVPQGNTSLQDRRVLPQGQAAATPAWTGGVDNRITRTLSNIHLQQEQLTAIPHGHINRTTTKQGYTQTWFCHKDTPQRYPHGHMACTTDILA